MSLISQFAKILTLSSLDTTSKNVVFIRQIYHHVEKPLPGTGTSYRRIVHYPEKYTVKPLNVTNLGGRDPVSGRLVARGIGGGIKHKYHWIDWNRIGPTEGPAQVTESLFTIFSY